MATQSHFNDEPLDVILMKIDNGNIIFPKGIIKCESFKNPLGK